MGGIYIFCVVIFSDVVHKLVWLVGEIGEICHPSFLRLERPEARKYQHRVQNLSSILVRFNAKYVRADFLKLSGKNNGYIK